MEGIKIGTYTGTGAAINLSLGFIPDAFITVNRTDADQIGIWFRGMTDGTAVDIAAAVANNAADGISDYVGDTTASPGVTIGTDYSENAKVYFYIAMRSGAGIAGLG